MRSSQPCYGAIPRVISMKQFVIFVTRPPVDRTMAVLLPWVLRVLRLQPPVWRIEFSRTHWSTKTILTTLLVCHAPYCNCETSWSLKRYWYWMHCRRVERRLLLEVFASSAHSTGTFFPFLPSWTASKFLHSRVSSKRRVLPLVPVANNAEVSMSTSASSCLQQQ